jgi:hypothetical protein
MFTINEAVEQSKRYAKTLSVFVQNKKVRDEIDQLIDSQAEYTKSAYNTAYKLGEVFVDSFGKYSIPKSAN